MKHFFALAISLILLAASVLPAAAVEASETAEAGEYR